MNTPSQMHVRKTAAILCATLGVYSVAAGAWVGIEVGLFASYSILLFVFGTAFLRAGYLVWYRWSPLAVRHLVGAIFFLITRTLMWVVPDGGGLIAFPICYFAYRLVALLWSRFAFAQSVPTAPRGDQRGF
jgi:hypothetical protein